MLGCPPYKLGIINSNAKFYLKKVLEIVMSAIFVVLNIRGQYLRSSTRVQSHRIGPKTQLFITYFQLFFISLPTSWVTGGGVFYSTRIDYKENWSLASPGKHIS